MRKAHVPFALGSIETFERQNNALPSLQPLENGAGQQLPGAFIELTFRHPTSQQGSDPSRCERRPALLDHSLGERCGLRSVGADDDNQTPWRVAQPV